jgi:hypothetical protein
VKRISIFGFLLLLTFAPFARSGPNYKEQLNGIIRDTQKQGSRAGRVTLVWWVPTEFWRATLIASGTIPADKVQEMVASIADINVFVVMDAKAGPLALEYVPQAELEKSFSVTDTNGKSLARLPEAKQSSAAKNLLGIMKPLFSNMLGEFGKNTSFFVFEGKNKDGSRRLDPTKPGVFYAQLSGEQFHWRLPLGSLLPDKICPKCNEIFPGSYTFCPYDATALKEKSPEPH